MAMDADSFRTDAYVIHTLMRDLVGHDRRPSAFLVYLSIDSEAGERSAALSHAELAEKTGLSRRAVQDSVRWLVRRELVSIERSRITEAAVYRVLRPWRRVAPSELPT